MLLDQLRSRFHAATSPVLYTVFGISGAHGGHAAGSVKDCKQWIQCRQDIGPVVDLNMEVDLALVIEKKQETAKSTRQWSAWIKFRGCNVDLETCGCEDTGIPIVDKLLYMAC